MIKLKHTNFKLQITNRHLIEKQVRTSQNNLRY